MMKFSKRKNRAKYTTKKHRLAKAFSPRHESLEDRRLLAGDLHNAAHPTDVNMDGVTSPLDALYIINKLNNDASGNVNGLAAISSNVAMDTNNDQSVSPIDVLKIINHLNAIAESEDGMLVQIRLQSSTADGSAAISEIGVGENFTLQAFVTDLTARDNGGVFAAYLDVMYDEALVTVSGGIDHSSSYGNSPSGNTSTAGLIDEVGSFDGLSPLGPNELLLFTIPMTADAAGTVTFNGDPADVSPLHDVLLFGVPDGEPNGIVSTDRIMFVDATLRIGGAVTTPDAVNDVYEINENTTLEVDAANGVLGNDSDPENDTLTATLVSDVSNGTLTLNEDGSFTYTPTADYSGADSFTYTASDGTTSSNATVSINVLAANAAPVAADDAYNIDEDTTLTAGLSVLGNDSDADNDSLTAVLDTTTTNGTLTLNADGTFTYTPDANFNGADSFTYRANDGQSDSGVATVTITVAAVNDGPVAVDDSYSTAGGTVLDISVAQGVLDNDTDIEGDPLLVVTSLTTAPANGTVDLLANGSFIYTPAVGFSGQDTFSYTVTDGDAADEGTVAIDVGGSTAVVIRLAITNEFGNVVSSVAPGSAFTLLGYVQDVSELPQDGVFAAYADVLFDNTLVTAGDTISYGDSYPNDHSGTILQDQGIVDEVGAFDGLNPLGADELLLFSIPFTAGQGGTAVFQAEPADILPAHDVLLFSENAPVPVSQVQYGSVSLVIESGDPPTAVDDEYSVDEDVVLTVSAATGVLSNDTDPSNDTLNAVLVNSTSNGTIALNADGSFTYTPNANFNGTDTFTYLANDGGTSSVSAATVTITVNPIDDAPVAVDDTYSLDGATSLVVNAADGVLNNDSDVEGDSLSATLVTGATSGEVTLNADGSFTYTPSSNLVGQDSFTYQVTAGGQVSNVGTVTILVGDLTPSNITGFVYVDSDNDGVKDSGELVFGDVVITLRGTNLFGDDVDLTTRTASDGSYSFNGLLRGEYTLIETQPLFIVDGLDTVDGQQSLRNDRFIIDLAAGTNAGDYNFGERGLMPEFIGNSMYFGSRSKTGLFSAIHPSGEQAWYCFDAGWDGLTSVNVDLAMNGETLDLTGTDSLGGTDTRTLAATGNSNVRVMGDMQRGMLVRLNGSASDFGIDPAIVDEILDGNDGG